LRIKFLAQKVAQKKKKRTLKTIGRIDKADFPELNLHNIEVKVDTGAYTSAIHCDHIEELEKDDIKQIKFKLSVTDGKSIRNVELCAQQYALKNIKSSNGLYQERYIIESTIVLFGKTYPISLSLSNRSNMRYPILLGRQLLKKRFTVNVARKNISYKRKMKQCT